MVTIVRKIYGIQNQITETNMDIKSCSIQCEIHGNDYLTTRTAIFSLAEKIMSSLARIVQILRNLHGQPSSPLSMPSMKSSILAIGMK